MKKLVILLIDFNFKTTMIRIFGSFFGGDGIYFIYSISCFEDLSVA